MDKREIYYKIMRELSKVVENHLNEMMSIIDVRDIDEMMNKCLEYYKEHGILDKIEREPDIDYEKIYLRNKNSSYKKTYELFADDLKKFNKNHTDILNKVFDKLENEYQLHDWQFTPYEDYGVKNGHISTGLPILPSTLVMKRYKNNVKVIINEMNAHGYILVKTPDALRGHERLVALVFNPSEEIPFNNQLYEDIDNGKEIYLCHTAPRAVYNSIMTYGIIPQEAKDKQDYWWPGKRAFFKYNYIDNDSEYEGMMKDIAIGRG